MAGWQQCQKTLPFSKNWLILVAFVLGLGYLYLTPPWQQNDEPGQFEYVWLAAHLDHWPQSGDVDVQMRQDVMASMIANRYFPEGVPIPSYRAHTSQPIFIAVSQIGSPPLYYFLASLPLRLFPNADIPQQLYLMRLTSLLLFTAAVYFAIQTTNLLFGSHLLGWLIAVFIAMLPQLAYRMTAANDDSAAVFSVMFFTWMSVRGIQRGPDWKTITGILGSVVLCALSKPTAWLALPFAILALLLSVFRAKTRLVWAGVFGVTLLAPLLAFEWNPTMPAYFYRNVDIINRVEQQTVDGSYTFETYNKRSSFYQILDAAAFRNVPGEKLTFGVWVWANQPIEASFPHVQFDRKDILKAGRVQLTNQPIFILAQAEIPDKFNKVLLRVTTIPPPEGVKVYWDCFILVPGARGMQSPPKTRNNCSEVEWDGYDGPNLIRNASAELGWLPLRGFAAGIISRTYHWQSSDIWSVFDPITSASYFKAAPNYLFRTFWGRFNWGTLGLVGAKPYRLFAVLSVLAFIGNGIAVWRYRKFIDWNQWLFLMLVMLAALVLTLARFIGNWDSPTTLVPQARYFFPVIFAAAFFICMGWYALIEIPLKWIRLHDYFAYIFIALFLAYNGWAWYTIWIYWAK